MAATVDEVRQCFLHAQKHSHVHKVKNRYDTSYDGLATFGYRDMSLQLTFPELHGSEYEGFVFELQILLDSFLAVKSEKGNKCYVQCRNLRGDRCGTESANLSQA